MKSPVVSGYALLAVAASGIVFGFIGFGDSLFNLLPARIYGVATDQSLLALPMFVFMGTMLEKNRPGHDMLEVMGRLAGRVPGGMAWASSCSV